MNYNKKGAIFAFEGLDGSGKETQTLLLEKRLKNDGFNILRVEFPSYDTEYSIFARKYLAGEFNFNIDPYVVSMFFSLDRLGVHRTLMKDYLNDGYILLCDRYVYSNLIYQGSRILDLEDRKKFFEWILKFEYDMCGLPKEEVTFFMDIPVDVSLELVKDRKQRDIHEKDYMFLKRCYENCNYVVDKYKLFRVNCFLNNQLLPIEKINDCIYSKILKTLQV